MTKKYIFIFLLSVVLIGCSDERTEQTFEDYFQNVMEERKKDYDKGVNYSYSLVHHVQNIVSKNDAIAIFKENNLQGEQIFIAYFEKENDIWSWRQTRGAEWDTSVKWSSMSEVPYIYSGAINDNSIVKVFVGKEPAKIIKVEDAKRFWYAISNVKEAEVKYLKENGTTELIDEIVRNL